jgi:hypothetical protein
MTSVLNVDTIAAKDGTSPVALTKQSAAKAWATFNATGTPAFRDSFNSSTLTDNGTGDMTISYVSSFNGANDYTTGGQSCHTSATTTLYCVQPYSDSVILTGSTRFSVLYNTASAAGVTDNSYCSTTNHGDLA